MKDLVKDFANDDMNLSAAETLSRSSENLKSSVGGNETESNDDSNTSNLSLENVGNEQPANDAQEMNSSRSSDSGSTSNKSDTAITTNKTILKKKHRLISADSGFGSCGRSELYTSGSIDSVAAIRAEPRNTTSVHTKATSKPDVVSPASELADQVSPLSVSSEAASKIEQRYSDKARTAMKNRNTTAMGSVDMAQGFLIDSNLINQNDGFKEVQCYFDENGSPRVREKKRTRRKSTLKQELKARSLGASYDDETLRKIHQNKTPSCVSFTRFCKKFKETFLSK